MGAKMKIEGKKRKKKKSYIQLREKGQGGVSRGGEILSCGNRSHTEGAGDRMDLIQREGQKK